MQKIKHKSNTIIFKTHNYFIDIVIIILFLQLDWYTYIINGQISLSTDKSS